MEVNKYFIEGYIYKCLSDTLKEIGFHLGDTYKCPKNGQLTNDKGVNTFMSETLMKAFAHVGSPITYKETEKVIEKAIEDKVNHPKHYINGPKIILERDYKEGESIIIECIDIIRNMPAWKANIIKYLWRAGKKSEEGYSISDKEVEDIQKAKWYLDNKLKEIELKKKYHV